MNLSNRKYVVLLIFLSIAFIFISRLFYLQLLDEKWKREAANISERKITIYPSRGLIYDRHGKLLVANTAIYDLMVVPDDVGQIDTVDFCNLVGITKAEFTKRMEKAKAYSRFRPSLFEKQIPADEYASIAEKLIHFNGFYGQSRTLRTYPLSTAAHVVGYLSEADAATIEKNAYYKMGDYIGAHGIESSYEKELRGKRGTQYVLVDVFNNVKGGYKEGLFDTLALSGEHITTTLDADLQLYGEYLMHNKMGSIVAIEPSTGEILSLVSSPSYDPNLLVGRIRGANYVKLSKDTLKPLFNRALMAKYPPGSTFKLINALIGLEEKTINANTFFGCQGGYHVGNFSMGCHAHASPVSLKNSIVTSCNAYYCNVFRSIIEKYPTTEEGYDKWYNHVQRFGLGKKTGIDLSNEVRGYVPPASYYNKIYGNHRWKPLTVISLAIGQGELGVTPIQMANLTATIANKGHYYTPHIVKEIGKQQLAKHGHREKHLTSIDPKHFELVVDAMGEVVERGTGRGVRFNEVRIGGKTGTAENPHGEDHSIFIAFAPLHNPKIAIAVYVENVGFGSTWAAPISSLMIEKYLTDTISRPDLEKRIVQHQTLKN